MVKRAFLKMVSYIYILFIDSTCHYSHLGWGRLRISKNIIQTGGYFNITKKIDEYGKFLQKICSDYLKEIGKDGQTIKEFLEFGLLTRNKYLARNSIKRKI